MSKVTMDRAINSLAEVVDSEIARALGGNALLIEHAAEEIVRLREVIEMLIRACEFVKDETSNWEGDPTVSMSLIGSVLGPAIDAAKKEPGVKIQ